jgi:hypothetical protein
LTAFVSEPGKEFPELQITISTRKASKRSAVVSLRVKRPGREDEIQIFLAYTLIK